MVFRHRQRARDEMRAWTAEPVLSEQEVLALERDPISRLWTDSIGLQWSISDEQMPPTGRPPRSGQMRQSELRWLAFQRGGIPRHVVIGPDVHLGELTREELQRLFDSA